MEWMQKINNWKNGEDIPTYPEDISKQFLWETTPITLGMREIFDEVFIESKKLDTQEEDWSSFSEYIDNSDDIYVVAFDNLTKDTRLVVPIPRKNREYTSIKLFMDNALLIQQIAFWKRVAIEIELMLEKYGKVWVSTHGLGVPYLHIRIAIHPKYYKCEEFKNM